MPLFLSGVCFVPPCYIYGTEFVTGIVWVFNIQTLDFYPIGGSGLGTSGMDYDDKSGFLYEIVTNSLYKIDLETGEQTYVGSWSASHDMCGIAINKGICYYSLDLLDDSIYIINLDTAELTLLGYSRLKIFYCSDMTFDKDNDTLYLAAYITTGQFYICDTTNGNCTLIGDFEGGAEVSGIAIPYYDYNQLPNAPSISVPDKVPRGRLFKVEFVTTDPESDDMYYRDEFNGYTSQWYGPFPSGQVYSYMMSISGASGTYNSRCLSKRY